MEKLVSDMVGYQVKYYGWGVVMFTKANADAQACHMDFGSYIDFDQTIVVRSNIYERKSSQLPWAIIFGPDSPDFTYIYADSHNWKGKVPRRVMRARWNPTAVEILGLCGRCVHYAGKTTTSKILFFLPFQPLTVKVTHNTQPVLTSAGTRR
jgi:hypothetical protein